MMFTTDIYLVDLALATLFDRRFQIVFGLVSAVYLIWRQPRPRKGASRKTVLITGCDSGMGHRIAKRLDEMKMYVFAGCLDPNGPGATSLKESCSDRLRIIPLDITKEEQVEEAVAFVKEHIPENEKGLYCLVNNAGVLAYCPFDFMTLDLCKQVFDVNLVGTLRVTKAFLPLIQRVPGRIVTITSIVARIPAPNCSIYTATKHALNGFFSSLRYDLAESGVHLALVEPGDFSRTTDIMQWTRQHLDEMWNHFSKKEQDDRKSLYDNLKRRINKEKSTPEAQEQNYKHVIEDVEDAMFAEEPYWRYVSAPLVHRIALFGMRLLPDSVRMMFVRNIVH